MWHHPDIANEALRQSGQETVLAATGNVRPLRWAIWATPLGNSPFFDWAAYQHLFCVVAGQLLQRKGNLQ